MNTQPQNRNEWHALIEEYKKSNIKRSKFCKQHGLVLHRFVYYLRDYNRRQQKISPTFSQVIIQSPPPLSTGIDVKIDLPNGIRCQVSCQINPNLLKQIMGALLLC